MAGNPIFRGYLYMLMIGMHSVPHSLSTNFRLFKHFGKTWFHDFWSEHREDFLFLCLISFFDESVSPQWVVQDFWGSNQSETTPSVLVANLSNKTTAIYIYIFNTFKDSHTPLCMFWGTFFLFEETSQAQKATNVSNWFHTHKSHRMLGSNRGLIVPTQTIHFYRASPENYFRFAFFNHPQTWVHSG